MPITITETPAIPSPLAPPRKRWTRYECEQLAATGLLDMEPLELIEGELIDKMGKNRFHVFIAGKLGDVMKKLFGENFVQSAAPIDLSPEDNPGSQPEPDVCVLNRSLEEFLTKNPTPTDIVLVAEVSDTTLQFDRTTKARLYARAGIIEYWIIDVNSRQLIVHRSPVEGLYTSVAAYEENEPIAPLAAPGAEFRTATVLPKLSSVQV